MSKRSAAAHVIDLSPEERLERAKKAIAADVVELVEAIVQRHAPTHEEVSQKHSPLGRRKHVELCRSGELPGRKIGRDWLVKRADLEAYIERHGIRRTKDVDQDVTDVIDRLTGGAK